MPHDEVETDQLTSSHLDGTDNRAAFSAAPLCEVRQLSAKRQAVASGGAQAAGA